MKKLLSILSIALFASWGNAQHSSSSVSTDTSSNISISVSSDDDDYSYSARFENDKTDAAKNVIVKALGKPTDETDRTAVWEGKGYSVSVRQGRVEMEMDKDEVTKSFQLKFEDLGDQVSESIGHVKPPKPPKPPKAPKAPKRK